MTRKEVRAKIAEYITENPQLTYRDIAAKLDCSISTVSGIAKEFNISRVLVEADLLKLTREEADNGR